jgi:hypothetical protein
LRRHYDALTPSRPRTGPVHVPLRRLDAWARDGQLGAEVAPWRR